MGEPGQPDQRSPAPVLPDYSGGCISGLIPGLLGPGPLPGWFPSPMHGARQQVMLIVDGLGWRQLEDHREVMPTLTSFTGGSITTVAPSTTATALTSIATGLTPGEHGIVGYRMVVHGEVLNTLRWATASGDARRRLVPGVVQPAPPFMGMRSPVVAKVETLNSGFTAAHLAGARYVGWRTPSSLVVEVRQLVRAGETFVLAYYDGVDKVAHEHGLGEHYRAELAFVDRLVADLLHELPADACLSVIADHGQVDVGDRLVFPHPDVVSQCSFQSGEGRFRWLHARGGRQSDLLAAAQAHHRDVAWVVSRDEIIDEGWFGPHVTTQARARFGDVALVPFEPVAFHDPDDSGPFTLVARHGSLTEAEMLVPLLAARAG
jgi:predicted AlkP superfamily pyrophosphatase or phosphodiesterase